MTLKARQPAIIGRWYVTIVHKRGSCAASRHTVLACCWSGLPIAFGIIGVLVSYYYCFNCKILLLTFSEQIIIVFLQKELMFTFRPTNIICRLNFISLCVTWPLFTQAQLQICKNVARGWVWGGGGEKKVLSSIQPQEQHLNVCFVVKSPLFLRISTTLGLRGICTSSN